jgi:hypothetical protein
MIKYSIKKNGLVTNVWFSDSGLNETHYEPCFGKPERVVLHKDELGAEPYDDADVLEELQVELQPAIDAVVELQPAVEAKEAVLDEEGNVLEPAVEAKEAVFREISPAVPAVIQKQVRLKAEYQIEIIDLLQDPEYLLQQCHNKRMAEYPSLGEFADAFVKMQNGDSTQMDAYVALCLAVKAKYPKP